MMRPKKPAVDQRPQLEQAGKEELVLHHAMAHARLFRRARHGKRVAQVLGNGFFAIDVLAGGDRLVQQLGAQLGGGGIEEQGVVRDS